MADSKFCAGCLRGDETNTGEAWCCDCAELVCKTCTGFHKRLSPPHKVVPVEKVSSLSSSLLTLSRNCEIHIDQKIAFFCCQDDKLICSSCVSESHKNCKPVIAIEKAAANVQHGTAITDLENRIDNLSHAMEKIVHLYSTQISGLNDKTKDFKKKVGDIRKKIIAYLDKIEADFKKKNDTKYKECSEILMKNKSEIQSRYDRLTTWKKDMVSLKHCTSNIQLFHVIKYLDAKTHNEETEFRKFKKDATIPTLNFKPAETMSNLRATLPSFGDITVDNITLPSSPDLDIDQQGQTFVRSEVQNNKLSLVNSFETSVLSDDDRKMTRGCFVPDNKLLLRGSSKVYVCSHDGSNINTINLDYEQSDVTLYDRDTALVSVGDKGIQIIDMKTLKPGKRIKVGSYCAGITSLNGKIWVNSDTCTLSMIDIKGKVQKEITTSFDPLFICLNKDGDIYCKDFGSNVYVVTSDGEERVVYSSPDLRDTAGITVDNHGDVYIAGYDSHNIHRISSDGKHGKQSNIILTEEDGIEYPRGLSFSHQTKELMVVNNIGKCINIYKVS